MMEEGRRTELGRTFSELIGLVPGISKYCVHICTNTDDCAAMTVAVARLGSTRDPGSDLNAETELAVHVANRCAESRVDFGLRNTLPLVVQLANIKL